MPIIPELEPTQLRLLGLRFKLTRTISSPETKDQSGIFSCLLETNQATHTYYALTSGDFVQPSIVYSPSESVRITLLEGNCDFETTVIHIFNLQKGINIIAVPIPENLIGNAVKFCEEASTITVVKETLHTGLNVFVHTERLVKADIVSNSEDSLFTIQLADVESPKHLPNGTLITICEQVSNTIIGCGLISGVKEIVLGGEGKSYKAVNLSTNLSRLKRVLLQDMCTMGVEENQSNDNGYEEDGVDTSPATCHAEARKEISMEARTDIEHYNHYDRLTSLQTKSSNNAQEQVQDSNMSQQITDFTKMIKLNDLNGDLDPVGIIGNKLKQANPQWKSDLDANGKEAATFTFENCPSFEEEGEREEFGEAEKYNVVQSANGVYGKYHSNAQNDPKCTDMEFNQQVTIQHRFYESSQEPQDNENRNKNELFDSVDKESDAPRMTVDVRRKKKTCPSRNESMQIIASNISNGRHMKSFTVGKDGGKCVLANMGVCLVVPEDALEEDTMIFIGISRNGNDMPTQGTGAGYMYSPVVVCGPHGLKFKVPVYLLFRHSLFFLSDEEVKVPEFFLSETSLLDKSDWHPHNGKMMVSRHHFVAAINGFTKYVWLSSHQNYYRMLRIMIFKEIFQDKPELVKITVYPVDAEEGEEQYVRGFAKGELVESEAFLFSENLGQDLTLHMQTGRNCGLVSENIKVVQFEYIVNNRQDFRNHCTFSLQTETRGPFRLTIEVSQGKSPCGQTRTIEVVDYSTQGGDSVLRDSGRFSDVSLPPVDDDRRPVVRHRPIPELDTSPPISLLNADDVADTLRNINSQDPAHSRGKSNNPSLYSGSSSDGNGHHPAFPSTYCNQPFSHLPPTQRQGQIYPQQENWSVETNYSSTGDNQQSGHVTGTMANNLHTNAHADEEQKIARGLSEEVPTTWTLPRESREAMTVALEQNSQLMAELTSILDIRFQVRWSARDIVNYIENISPLQKADVVHLFKNHGLPFPSLTI